MLLIAAAGTYMCWGARWLESNSLLTWPRHAFASLSTVEALYVSFNGSTVVWCILIKAAAYGVLRTKNQRIVTADVGKHMIAA